MTVFRCRACGKPLTGPLRRLDEWPEQGPAEPGGIGQPVVATVPRGTYTVDPEPFGAPYVAPVEPGPDAPANVLVPGGPRGTFVLHPEDVSGLLRHPDPRRNAGCCGPDGMEGVNRVCRCGAEVATLVADCWTARELRFDPKRVRAQP